MSVASDVSFSSFCELCVKLSDGVRDKKTQVLNSFICKWREQGVRLKGENDQIDCSFYPVLRFLLPQLDRERGAYGVKEHTLAKIYIRILCLPKGGKDAHKLLDYKAPKAAGNQAGDFAEVAFWILKNRCSEGGQLSIEDVNKHLDGIAEKHAAHDPRGVDSELVALLQQTSAEEQKWLMRIILKDMKLGLGQNKVLMAYHPDAKHLYDVSNNLAKICDTLVDPMVRLHEVEVEVFAAFRPMLAEECDVRKVGTYLKSCPSYFVETKLDGERFQVHMQDNTFKYFSRNGFDYTDNYGADRLGGTLTPLLAAQVSHKVSSLILDGEMMAWNTNTNTFTSKGMNIDVKTLKDTSVHRPCFAAFDILFLNGEVLSNKPLVERLEILAQVTSPREGVLVHVQRRRVSTKEEIWASLNEAMDHSEEGIMMKEMLAVYKPGVRKDGGWYKIKPEYTDGLMDQLDVLILGGYYGGGRRSGDVSHFLVGVAVTDETKDGVPALFHSMARVGSGYTMKELAQLQALLQPHWKQVNVTPPRCIEWTKEKPDVWIDPADSFILQVKASEIVPSDLYRTGYTLRFPRVEKVRYDKSWTQCLTTGQFEEKRKNASGKLYAGHVTEEGEASVKRPRRAARPTATLAAHFTASNVADIEPVSDLLAGKEICVSGGWGAWSKEEVERRVVLFGGQLVQNPGVSTYCVLAEDTPLRVKNMIRSGSYNVVRTSWFLEQLFEGATALPSLLPRHCLGLSHATRAALSQEYDEYGDHFTQPATVQSLQQCLSSIQGAKPSVMQMEEMDVELFGGYSPYSVFRGCTAYLQGCSEHLTTCALLFRFYGGHVATSLTSDVTHVLFDAGDWSGAQEASKLNHSRSKKLHLVKDTWVRACICAKTRLD